MWKGDEGQSDQSLLDIVSGRSKSKLRHSKDFSGRYAPKLHCQKVKNEGYEYQLHSFVWTEFSTKDQSRLRWEMACGRMTCDAFLCSWVSFPLKWSIHATQLGGQNLCMAEALPSYLSGDILLGNKHRCEWQLLALVSQFGTLLYHDHRFDHRRYAVPLWDTSCIIVGIHLGIESKISIPNSLCDRSWTIQIDVSDLNWSLPPDRSHPVAEGLLQVHAIWAQSRATMQKLLQQRATHHRWQSRIQLLMPTLSKSLASSAQHVAES